jgi:hypothetical protein
MPVASATPTMQSLAALALREMGADTVTTQSLMRIAVVLATAVNKAPGLKGVEKQKLVLDALREVLATVSAEHLDADAKAILTNAIDNIIPQTLTLVVEAGRSGALKKPTAGCVSAFAALFCRAAASSMTAAHVGPPAVAQALDAAAMVADTVQVDPVVETTEQEPTPVQQETTSASEESSQSPDTAPAEQ